MAKKTEMGRQMTEEKGDDILWQKRQRRADDDGAEDVMAKKTEKG